MTQLINQLMNDKAVNRTATATPGLLKILGRTTCLGFFNIEEFYQSCSFGYLLGIFLDIKPTCCTRKSFMYDLYKYFRFSSKMLFK